MSFVPEYLFEGEPPLGETIEVAPGLHWLRMPLPFKLNHINLWLLEDGDGWTIIDTGICTDEVKAAWQTLFSGTMAGRPVQRVIVTHFHPDHVGLAGWLTDTFEAPLHMPLTEWAFGRMLAGCDPADSAGQYDSFYQRAGFTPDMMETVGRRIGGYGARISTIPTAFHRLSEGDDLLIGDRTWRVIVGRGHSPEHACLYCAADDILISGDQVLPKISPNVSVWPQEPDGRPLGQFLASLDHIAEQIGGDPMVLPSHNWPFRGLHARLQDLQDHHMDRLEETLATLDAPRCALDVQQALFKRPLDEHQMFFAIGETLAHLHHLMHQGRVTRSTGGDGIDLFSRAV